MVSFFSLLLWIPGENRPSWRNYLIWTAEWGREHDVLDRQNTLNIFLSTIAVMQVIFRTEDNFFFIFDCMNSFNCKLKKVIDEQIIIFLHSVHLTNPYRQKISSIILSLVRVPFSLFQSANTRFLLMNTSSVKQIEEICKRALSLKAGVFIVLPLIYNQN